jgi:hypothetical protein
VGIRHLLLKRRMCASGIDKWGLAHLDISTLHCTNSSNITT